MSVFEILKKCQEQGIALQVNPNGRLGIKGPKGTLKGSIIEILKNRKEEILKMLTVIEQFQEAGIHGTICQDVDGLLNNPECKPVPCPYKGELREIHPSVCEWHREEGDSKCEGCSNRVLH